MCISFDHTVLTQTVREEFSVAWFSKDYELHVLDKIHNWFSSNKVNIWVKFNWVLLMEAIVKGSHHESEIIQGILSGNLRQNTQVITSPNTSNLFQFICEQKQIKSLISMQPGQYPMKLHCCGKNDFTKEGQCFPVTCPFSVLKW